MASFSEKDLCCPFCQDIYKDPVLLSCNHSFCRTCVENWWKTSESRECPTCKKRMSNELPPYMCHLHREELTVFCEEHQQLLCTMCEQLHSGHTIRAIEEAAPDFKQQLQQSLQPLRDQRQDFNRTKDQFSAAVAHIETQARLTERQIQDEFKKLHQFLEEEEQVRIRALREEEEQKRKSLEDKMAAVSREIEALSETIAATEEQLGAADLSFLLQYKAAVERVQRCPLVERPQLDPGALIDQAKHLGNLGFNIWNNMKDLFQFYPVVLDSNTANQRLIISEDLTSVKFGERQTFPENPERFQWYRVLGSEGFSSGTHSWEVEVCGEDYWSVGVVNESVQKKTYANTGVWEIYFENGAYEASSGHGSDELCVQNLRRVRVLLDCDKGTLSFCDADTNMQLHTFKPSLSERLFPYFQTFNTSLKVLPLNISVSVK